jgi:hypothetical protein
MKIGGMVNFSKYYELADEDDDFLLLLLNQTYLDYSNTAERYLVLVKERDLVNLGRVIHKIKPTLVMFELNELESKIEHHKSVLFTNGPEDEINELTQQIVADLELVLVEISEKCLAIKSKMV